MFPDIARARHWYYSTKDGLLCLRRGISAPRRPDGISAITDDATFGMTQAEWKDYLHARLGEHELFASLALMAACEGAIRRDVQWRISGQRSQHHGFSWVSGKGHLKISTILNRWIQVVGANSYAGRRLNRLLGMYIGRNALAHGLAPMGSVVFEAIWEELCKIEDKWKQAVPDFRGF
jgi:hypothetical protein